MSNSDATSPLLNNTNSDSSNQNGLFTQYSKHVAVISLLSLISTPILMILNSGNFFSPFTLHPIFQCIAISLIVLSILSLQPTSSGNSKLKAFDKHRKFISYFSLPFFLIGSSAMFYNKFSHSAPHFTTWHSTFGLISLSFLILQASVGIAFTIPSKDSPILPKSLYKYHRLSGYFVLLPLLAITATLGAGHSTWSSTQAPLPVRLIFVDTAAILLVLSIWSGIQKHKLGF
ncbi:hypothetical protein J056_001772 [Wallemia ichthyophaga EXF-994]|uniref:Cytochrome b561 domain-containing protein n=1 Tax=Wallemia ichthyophaga (strain EXF-994 / CBS 113033) TaxID=1299270 RepID=R9ABK5_WALI9|nr:uncharacterized protein J056_001772 [Wallemia ichthyophaga EXF-994]EOQ99449.1 hypothetical protein J056_001772 [Wallemia ichthyophaga EXF-994]